MTIDSSRFEASRYAFPMPGAVSTLWSRVVSYIDCLKRTELFDDSGDDGEPVELRYEPGLEGLRTVLLGAVIVGHSVQFLYAPSWFRFTAFGSLTIFFVLSGFLVTAILLRSYERGYGMQYRKFMWRRVLRLGTPLYLFAVVNLLVAWADGYKMFTPEGSRVLGAIPNFLSIITYTINLVPSFGHIALFSSVHLWSLGVDMQVYIVLPIIIALMLRRTHNLWIIFKWLTAVIIVLQFTRYAEFRYFFDEQAATKTFDGLVAYSGVYQRPENNIDAFLAGVLFAMLWKSKSLPLRFLSRLWVPASVAFVLMMIFVVVMSPVPYAGGYSFAILCSVVIIAECLRIGSPLQRLMSTFPMLLLGRVSYTMYIWHLLVMIKVKQWTEGLIGGPLLVLVTLLALALVSTAAWWIAERPLMRLPRLREVTSRAK